MPQGHQHKPMVRCMAWPSRYLWCQFRQAVALAVPARYSPCAGHRVEVQAGLTWGLSPNGVWQMRVQPVHSLTGMRQWCWNSANGHHCQEKKHEKTYKQVMFSPAAAKLLCTASPGSSTVAAL